LSQTGVFETLAALSRTAPPVQRFDSTVVRAPVSAAGANGGQEDEALGRSRGGFSTKIHLKVDLEGLPLAFLSRPAARPGTVRSSRSCSTSDPRSPRARPSVTRGMMPRPTAKRRARGICPAIPYQSSAKNRPAFFPAVLYKARACILVKSVQRPSVVKPTGFKAQE
jgi:hypothetical protein